MNTTRPPALHPHRQHADLSGINPQPIPPTDWARVSLAVASVMACVVLAMEVLS